MAEPKLPLLKELQLILGGAMIGSCLGGITYSFFGTDIIARNDWATVGAAIMASVVAIWRWRARHPSGG